jgi:flagellar motor switch protein FliM
MEKILSQEEIDALLKGMDSGAVDTRADSGDGSGIITYDLANQDRIIRGRMPTLEILNDHFSRLFRNSLSMSLRRMVDVGARSVQMLKFGEFVRTLPVPSSLHIFKMEPLRGHAILVIDSKLVFTLIDVFLGGTGKTNFRVEGRDFTSIENRLIHRVVTMVLAELEKAWCTLQPFSMQYVRSEINPQFASIVPPSDLVITIPFGIEIEQFTGMITVCVPYSVVEPIKSKLYSGYQSDRLEADQTWIDRFVERLKFAEVEFRIELGQGKLTVNDLLKLKVGDVVPLDKEVAEPLICEVQGIPKFLGRAGVYGGSKAFQIESRVKN